jgi:hypothetical protein
MPRELLKLVTVPSSLSIRHGCFMSVFVPRNTGMIDMVNVLMSPVFLLSSLTGLRAEPPPSTLAISHTGHELDATPFVGAYDFDFGSARH